LRSDATRREAFAGVIARLGGQPLEATADVKPGAEKDQYSYIYSARYSPKCRSMPNWDGFACRALSPAMV
jgi:hypothetical protein